MTEAWSSAIAEAQVEAIDEIVAIGSPPTQRLLTPSVTASAHAVLATWGSKGRGGGGEAAVTPARRRRKSADGAIACAQRAFVHPACIAP